MNNLKALLVFCEGPHDVAFCRSIFKFFFDIKETNWKFSDYPSPLNQIFKTSMKNHAAKDMSLDMAHKFFLPDKTLLGENDSHIVLLFNSGGKTKPENPKQFLADFLALIESAATLPGDAAKIISDVNYLFIYDADHEAAQTVFDTCRSSFSDIEGAPFIEKDFTPLPENPFAGISDNKAVYIWGDPETNKGTLEDVLIPLFKIRNEETINRAEKFIDDSFTWHIDHAIEKRRIAARAKRNKAIITSAGQGEKPGRPMGTVVHDSILAKKKEFIADENVKKFADFISTFWGIEKKI